MNFSIKNKVALVTGGYSGIGEAIVKAFLEEGAKVSILGRELEKGQKFLEQLGELKENCRFIEGDVSVQQDCIKAVEQTVEFFGRLDVGVNNAGVVTCAPAEEMPIDEWDYVNQVNLRGTFMLCQEMAKQMIKQGDGGSIINLSSVSARIVNVPQCQITYNVTKAGVSHMSRIMAYEWAKYGIRVNAIEPGYVDTPTIQKSKDTDWYKVWVGHTPIGRLGKTEEIAGLAQYLASDISAYMTGSCLLIDGGYSLA